MMLHRQLVSSVSSLQAHLYAATNAADSLRNALESLVLSHNQQPTTTAAKDIQEAKTKRYAFWETQPVPKFGGMFGGFPKVSLNLCR
jgi:hypothetical protein